MILLSTPTSTLLLVTGGAETVDVDVSWVDAGPTPLPPLVTPITPSNLNTQISAPTTTIICPSPPGPNVQRNIKYVSIVNTDPTNPITISVQKFDGSTISTEIPSFSLGPLYGLYYEDGGKSWYLKYQGADVIINVALTGVAVSAGTQVAISGTAVFSNSNNISFGMSGSSVVTALAEFNISAGTTSQNLSALTFLNSNGLSFGLNGSVVTASIAAEISNINVSAGTTSNNLSAITFSNSNNVSFGLNGSVITASVNADALAIGAIAAGTQTATSGTVVFSNSNNVSFGMNGSSLVTASIATSLTNINVSAGTTSNNLSAITFSNSNGLSFGLNGSVITASAVVNQSIAIFSQDADFVTNFGVSQANLSFQKVSFPMNLLATQLAVLVNVSGATDASGAFTLSHAVYTLNNGTASLASSASRVISWTSGSQTTATSIYGGVSGTRYRTMGVSYSLTPGDYLCGWWAQTTNNCSISYFGRAGLNVVGTFDGVETAHFLNGTYISSTAAFPVSIAATDSNYVRTGAPPMRQPGGIFIGMGG
jgi:hypothetical protein